MGLLTGTLKSHGCSTDQSDVRYLLATCGVLTALYIAWAVSLPVEIRQEIPPAEPASIATVFFDVQADATWPVPSSPVSDISSTFGPRIRQSTGVYDFHRGIDIHADAGAAVVAAYPGTFYGIRTFASGGLTVILEHELPAPVLFHGQEVDRFFTLYMHLSEVESFLREAPEPGETARLSEPLLVEVGTKIARVGDSGDTVSSHLHFELRLGSQCSLEFQLGNPDGSCLELGADPHIHPMVLFAPGSLDIESRVVNPVTATTPGVFEVSTSDHRPLLVAYVLDAVAADGSVAQRFTLDLNTRTGFDATTNARLDRPDLASPFLVPQVFNHESDEWTMRYVVPAEALSEDAVDSLRFTTLDVWGRSSTLILGAPKTP